MLKYNNSTLAEVQNLAAKLAHELTGKKAMIGLIGNLGSGKTTFVKAFAKELKITKISSPTFVIAHEYKISRGRLYHFDFYRLNDSKQLGPLGFDEILDGHNLVLAEWADKFPSIKNRCDILITFKVRPGNKRDVTIQTA